MLKTGNTIVSIYTEMTPNPETMKFVANKLLYPGKSIDFPDEMSAAPFSPGKRTVRIPFHTRRIHSQQLCDADQNSRNTMGRSDTIRS